MQSYSLDEIRQCFSRSTDFNEIFDMFQSAISQGLKDLEQYRLLFWNHSLSSHEVCLFGEKLAEVFPDVSFDVYLWLASVFEVTCSSDDNYELAFHYYRKAAAARPDHPDPYLDACDCYDPDLNIPPVTSLIEFLKSGSESVSNPAPLFKRLSHLYEYAGDLSQSEWYRQKAEERSGRHGSNPAS